MLTSFFVIFCFCLSFSMFACFFPCSVASSLLSLRVLWWVWIACFYVPLFLHDYSFLHVFFCLFYYIIICFLTCSPKNSCVSSHDVPLFSWVVLFRVHLFLLVFHCMTCARALSLLLLRLHVLLHVFAQLTVPAHSGAEQLRIQT